MHDGRRPRVVRSRHTLAWLRGPLTKRELGLLGTSTPKQEGVADGLLGAPPAAPEGLPTRWLRGAAGDRWRPAVYARWRLRGGVGDGERLVHRFLMLVDDPQGAPEARSLDDSDLLRAEPDVERRYEPIPGWVRAEALRDAWLEGVLFDEEVQGPEGPERVDRRDVVGAGMVLVWV